ncbi:MAG TPA: J domain-containing protein, partial [Candidatus Saccharicenans sp.]|nr:J domain-containing protein [Candidatus Saccharicenans sp.]
MAIRLPDWLKKSPSQVIAEKIRPSLAPSDEKKPTIREQIETGTGFWGTPIVDQPIGQKIRGIATPIADFLTTRQPIPEQVREKIPEKIRPVADVAQKVMETPRVAAFSLLLGTPETREAREQEARRFAELDRKFLLDPAGFLRSDEAKENNTLLTKNLTSAALTFGGVKNVSGWHQVGARMPETEARKILNVKKEATEEEIKSAYRNFVKKWRPEKGGTEQASKTGQMAYESLMEAVRGKPKTSPMGPLALGPGKEMAKEATVSPPSPPVPPTIKPPADPVENGLRQRGFLETIKKGEKLSPEFTEGVKNLEQTYIPHTNQEAISWAEKKISTDGLDKSLDWARNLKVSDLEKNSDKAGAIFERAIKKSIEVGDNDRAISLADEADNLFRGGGRLVQAASIWNNMSPQAMVRYA